MLAGPTPVRALGGAALLILFAMLRSPNAACHSSRLSRAAGACVPIPAKSLPLRAAPIELRFDPERFFADLGDERFVVRRHDDDAVLAHRVAAPIFL